MTMSPERLAITIAAHAADRKASDIVDTHENPSGRRYR